MQHFTPALFNDHDIYIANELRYIHGEDSLIHPWEIPDPTCYSLDLRLESLSKYPHSFQIDPARSGGVHPLIREYLAATTKYSQSELAEIPIQKDFLFVPAIERKYLQSRRLVVLSTIETDTKTRRSIKTLLQSGFRRSKVCGNLPEFISAPHPVHWFSTEKYQQYLPDVWRTGRVCLVVLPKSTFVVRRELSPLAIDRIVSSIRERGLLPIACVYPDQHSLLAYHSLLRISRFFDDIVVAGPVTSLYQMAKLLTYIDAASEICVPECDYDPIGPLSIACILGIRRGRYVTIAKEDIHVFVNQSRRAKKILQRYPSPAILSRIMRLSNALSAAASTSEQADLLQTNHVLDIRPP